mgnify:CR=1 FL=1
MVKYLFLIGRPGSGKTTFIQILTDILKKQSKDFEIHNDWSILYGYAQNKKHTGLIELSENGFKVLNEKLYTTALEELISKILINDKKSEFQIIEFSRRNYYECFVLIEQMIKMEIFYIVYIDSDYNNCLSRNIKRESHQVPLDIMELHFKFDDKNELIIHHLPVVEISNKSDIRCLKNEAMFFFKHYCS